MWFYLKLFGVRVYVEWHPWEFGMETFPSGGCNNYLYWVGPVHFSLSTKCRQ